MYCQSILAFFYVNRSKQTRFCAISGVCRVLLRDLTTFSLYTFIDLWSWWWCWIQFYFIFLLKSTYEQFQKLQVTEKQNLVKKFVTNRFEFIEQFDLEQIHLVPSCLKVTAVVNLYCKTILKFLLRYFDKRNVI